jgi:hypothetical protein
MENVSRVSVDMTGADTHAGGAPIPGEPIPAVEAAGVNFAAMGAQPATRGASADRFDVQQARQ